VPSDSPILRAGRGAGDLRPVTFTPGVSPYAEGSCMIAFGETRVLCTASIEEGVPGWRRGSGEGWLTAEYAMLPRATRTRTNRERAQLGGRTQEIQRLIGRSVRAMLDDFRFGELTVKVDCDVLQADGGTRTASITGASVAVAQAFAHLVRQGRLPVTPVKRLVAAVSVGIVGGEVRLDLDYPEDVGAGVDMNVVMSDAKAFVEVQGTAERGTFDRQELGGMLDAAVAGIARLDQLQREALGAA
jgi:ribonuclease PH